MTCDVIEGEGLTIIACARGKRGRRCRFCGERASLLCDYPLRGLKVGRTCSLPLCRACAKSRPLDGSATADYCPPHARAIDEQPQQQLKLEVPR